MSNYELPKSEWRKLFDQANELDDREVERHAWVSIHNRHRCEQCFTCACREVLRQRARRKRGEAFISPK